MTKQVASTTKKVLAASGVAFGLAGFGMFGTAGIAAADGTAPDTGSYDELLDIVDDNATHEVPITGSYGPDMGSYDELTNILDSDGIQADKP